ncbi:CIMIP2 protein CG18335-like isoform X2 [Rhodnius prolixus]
MKSRFGSSYSALSHKILLDPQVRHSHKLVLSDTEVGDYMLNAKKEKCDQVQAKVPPLERDEELDRDDMDYYEKYKFPISPGYAGHLPKTNDTYGMPRTKKAEETVSCLKERLKKQHRTRKELEKINDMRYGKREVQTIADKQLLKNEFTLPLIEVRPEYTSIIRNVFRDEESKCFETREPKLPYSLDGLDEEKYFIPGYAGHVPFGYSKFGENFQNATNSALKDFSFKFNRMKSTEWAPVGTLRDQPALVSIPHHIYSEKHGLIPNYGGFVPGIQFRYGKTFGEVTRDAKKWQRGDLTN